jgi:hypothetical protein
LYTMRPVGQGGEGQYTTNSPAMLTYLLGFRILIVKREV